MELSLPEPNLLLPNGISVCFVGSEPQKGQLISKGLFAILEFLQKTIETIKKNPRICSLEELSARKNQYDFV